jgi:hypothetical protein
MSQEPGVKLKTGNSPSWGELRFSSFMLFPHTHARRLAHDGKLPNLNPKPLCLIRLDGKGAKNDFKNLYVRSRYVHENKQKVDKMTGKKRVFMHKFRTFTSNRHEFAEQSRFMAAICQSNLLFHMFSNRLSSPSSFWS